MTQQPHFSPEQEALLSQPLDINLIKHRPGAGGKMLKYLSGDTVIETANKIFGYGQWGYTITSRSHEVIADGKKGQVDVYTADIELSVVGSAFPFPGDGVGIVNAPYTAEAHELARKSATTDALKRALRHYGDSFGLCLYDEDDYVDAGGGQLVQVREVTPQRQAQQPRRIVDAASPAPRLVAPPVDETIRNKLNSLMLLGQTHGRFSKRSGLATYASQVLNRTVEAEQLIHLSEGELVEVECSLQAAIGDEEQQAAS